MRFTFRSSYTSVLLVGLAVGCGDSKPTQPDVSNIKPGDVQKPEKGNKPPPPPPAPK